MKPLQTISFTAFLCLMLVVMGGTVFSVLVEYPNWFANVPSSLEATRNFYKVFHPGYFFQTMAPLAFVSGVLFAIVGWKITGARNFVMMSLVLLIAAELLTFFYIYPRLGILFGPDATTQSIDALRLAAQQFTTADQIRTCLSTLANILAVSAMFKFFRARYAMS